MKKPANDIIQLAEGNLDEIANLPQSERIKHTGLGCGVLLEPIPSFIKAPCEWVLEGSNNTSIVFGRDRNGPRFVIDEYDNGENLGPYGPKGYTKCGTVDIVAGRHSAKSISRIKLGNIEREIKVNPDFFLDAARIYISQKTDVDYNFKIGSKENRTSSGKSAIALKADAVRIISRESIKLITGTDTKNSLGGKIFKTEGIDLIAGNDDADLQAMVKGGNLEQALQRLVKHVSALNGVIDAFLKYQMSFNETMMTHTHISPFYGLPTTPSETAFIDGRRTAFQLLTDVQTGLMSNKLNLANFKNSYLKISGEKYINSRHNRTN